MTTIASTSDSVELELEGPIAILRLDRPRVHNVVDSAMIGELERHLATLDRHPEVIVLILTGAGTQTFCAGSDLDEITQLENIEDGLPWIRRMQTVLDRLESGPQVTLGAINGSAYGGGCELLTACHFRLAADTARFSFRQASIGLLTGWGGGGRLFRQLGRSAAVRLLLTADTVDAETAMELGLIDQVVPRDQVLSTALELAERMVGNNHNSLRGFLRVAQAVETDPGASTLDLETSLFSELFEGDHFRRIAADWRARRRNQQKPC